ncbi:hypothetical protein BDP81DRAFT_405961 [Colletotrichum phormii]|uniref:Uncharacterized protein n=1 Tax=Colletotrichum phormii TaxID=359342 RepID=A0AAI9ZUA6_9PEZI|nr:uncharacterized protein BDP81DRAFT_405961 [Colletotrichum phormii]KAK1636974.1 hypothetical protein BDP81DRAFT_405961 [Colletotrichum phormii]
MYVFDALHFIYFSFLFLSSNCCIFVRFHVRPPLSWHRCRQRHSPKLWFPFPWQNSGSSVHKLSQVAPQGDTTFFSLHMRACGGIPPFAADNTDAFIVITSRIQIHDAFSDS